MGVSLKFSLMDRSRRRWFEKERLMIFIVVINYRKGKLRSLRQSSRSYNVLMVKWQDRVPIFWAVKGADA
jgi:hypothetical protein